MTPRQLARVVNQAAADLGCAACGITGPEPLPHAGALDAWLDAGMHGEMHYLARQAARRREPLLAWPRARSIVVVLYNYYSDSDETRSGYRVARYAQGDDYHDVMLAVLDELGRRLKAAAGTGECRSYVDAGPMAERELAQRAGLGWIAKNTMLIRPGVGSYTFIGVLLTDLELERDAPFEADRCGTCTRCLEACPTEAFAAERVLDARRCISYLTIEARGDVPSPLRAAVGDHLFGCDVCQDVCPWNVRFATETAEPRLRPAAPWPTLEEILAMDPGAFDARFGTTAVERARLPGLQRNARVVLENAALTSAGVGARPAG